MYKHIMVTTDGSVLSNKAIKFAVGLAKSIGARLTAFHATPAYSPQVYVEGGAIYAPRLTKARFAEENKARADQVFGKVKQAAGKAGIEANLIHRESAQPFEAIINAAKAAKCDLIVMASHGRRGLVGVLLGSETQKVITHGKIPVLVIR
jgi:nucleotide-binding universal stress UspA family protein